MQNKILSADYTRKFPKLIRVFPLHGEQLYLHYAIRLYTLAEQSHTQVGRLLERNEYRKDLDQLLQSLEDETLPIQQQLKQTLERSISFFEGCYAIDRDAHELFDAILEMLQGYLGNTRVFEDGFLLPLAAQLQRHKNRMSFDDDLPNLGDLMSVQRGLQLFLSETAERSDIVKAAANYCIQSTPPALRATIYEKMIYLLRCVQQVSATLPRTEQCLHQWSQHIRYREAQELYN